MLQTTEELSLPYTVLHPPKQLHLARPQYIRILGQQMLLHMLLFKTKKQHKGKQNTERSMKC